MIGKALREGLRDGEYPRRSCGEEMRSVESKREAGEICFLGFPMGTGIKHGFWFPISGRIFIIS